MRLMCADKQEYPCRIIDISVGGAAINSTAKPKIGETIIAYLDQLGGLQGTVVRILDGGFAISFITTQHKREKLAAQITWLINRQELGGPEDRRHERIALKEHVSTLKIDDATSVACNVLDISLSGALIETTAFPAIGSEVMLGKLRARVVRRDLQNIGVEFLDIQEKEALRRHFV